ncbi:MAG: BLUF domain-containing protein [Novosphingobium sp.]
MPFECWLYTSRSLMTDYVKELGPLVEVSRRRNAALEVTGALIFTGSHFAQYLEGPAEAVAAIRASIERDPRHAEIRTARTEPCGERRFGGWTLAYANHAEPFDRLIAVARTMRGPAGQELLLEMIRRFVEAPLD